MAIYISMHYIICTLRETKKTQSIHTPRLLLNVILAMRVVFQAPPEGSEPFMISIRPWFLLSFRILKFRPKENQQHGATIEIKLPCNMFAFAT